MLSLALMLALAPQEMAPATPPTETPQAEAPATPPAEPPQTEAPTTEAPGLESTSGGRALAAAPPLAADEIETVTRVRYTVNTEGRIEGCTIVESDAPAAVQANICATLTERGRFKPKLEDGKPVAVEQEKTVRFRAKASGADTPSTPAGRTDLPPGR